MRLSYLKLENFLSFKSATLDLTNKGLVLVKGENQDSLAADSNGAGKSALFEAVIYALWGKTSRGVSHDEVVNRTKGKNCCVELWFTDNKENLYKIARYRKHDQFKNELFFSLVLEGGTETDLRGKSIHETQEKIEEIFGIDYETASNVFIAGQGLPARFTQAADAEKKRILEKILQLSFLPQCLKLVRGKLSLTRGLVTDIGNRIITRKAVIDLAQSTLDKLQVEKDIFEKKKVGKIAELQNAYTQVLGEVNSLKLSLSGRFEIEKTIKDAETKLKELEEDSREELSQQLTMKKLNCAGLVEHYNSCTKELNHFREELGKVKALNLDETCPTCGNSITQQGIETVTATCEEGIKGCHLEQVLVDHDIKEREREIEELEERLSQENQKAALRKRILDKIPQEQIKLAKLGNIEERLSQVQLRQEEIDGELIKIQAEEFSSVESLESLRLDISKNKAAINVLEKNLLSVTEEISYLEFWERGFGDKGIKSYVFDLVVPFLNERVNTYARQLGLGDFRIEFKTQRTLSSGETADYFVVEVLDQDTDVYQSSSGGEKQRIDICVMLALQDLLTTRSVGEFNIAVFDEIFVNLDESGVEKVVELLIETSKNKESVFVITHDERLQEYFHSILTVRKENGFSFLV